MITHDDSRWSDLFSGKNAASAIALSLGVALHAINILVATTILPSVVQDIGGLDLYAWNTTLFVVASILGSALSARLLGGYGARSAIWWLRCSSSPGRRCARWRRACR